MGIEKNIGLWDDEEFEEQLSIVKDLLKSIAAENRLVIENGIDVTKVIESLEQQRNKFKTLSDRLAHISAQSAELMVDLEEKNERLAEVSARSAELMADLEEKNDALRSANTELARANSHAAELMAEIEIKDDEIKGLNKALSNANVQASELVAEIETQAEQLKDSQHRFSVLFNNTNDAIFVHMMDENTPGRFVEVNESACGLLGLTRDELMAMGPNDIRDGSDALDDLMDPHGKVNDVIYRSLRSADGRVIPVEINLKRFNYQQDSLVLAIARDITERVEAEEERAEFLHRLEMVNQELLKAHRLKDQFLSFTSHELRSPLSSLMKILKVIREKGYDDEEELMEMIDLSFETSEHLYKITNDLLDLSRIESGKLQLDITSFDIIELVDSTLELYRNKIEKTGVELLFMPDDFDGMVMADRTRVRQIISNLLSNAYKFTNEGQIIIKAEPKSENVHISVKDTGHGIEPKDLWKIFQPFSQLPGRDQKKGKGTGLGLAICHSLTEKMNGKIWAESEGIGTGSTFILELPTTQEAAHGA